MKPRAYQLDRLAFFGAALTLLMGLSLVSSAAPEIPIIGGDGQPDKEYYDSGQRPFVADGNAYYVPNEYIIHVIPGTSLSAVQRAVEAMGASVVKAIALPDTYLIRIGQPAQTRSPRYIVASSGSRAATPGGYSTPTAYTSWVIDRIQPNVIYRPTVEPTTDPIWVDQWDMTMINMPAAWDIEKGSERITVAVIDTGVAYTHPDLINRCVPGYDTFNGDYDPFDTPPGDGVGHGTHVAGTIAAQGDNGEGVCGVCWDNVKILPIRALGPLDDNETGGTTETITAAMEYAMTHDVQVVNMSIGGPPRADDGAYRLKVAQLVQAGIIVVVSAGNEGDTSDPRVGVPALYPEVICVGSVGPTDEIAVYSSYGPAYEVDIAAPGGEAYLDENNEVQGEVWSTYIWWVPWEGHEGWWIGTYGYEPLEGTSMACPHVAGAAALLLSQGIPAREVRSRLLESARPPKEPLEFDRRKYGAGILDVQAALSNSSLKIVEPARGTTVSENPDFKITMRGIDATTIKVYIDYADATEDGIPDNPAGEIPIIDGVNAAQTSIEFNWSEISSTPLRAGRHFLYVTGYSKFGGSAISDWITFTVSGRFVSEGLHLFSFPFILDTTSVLPTDILLGTDFSLTSPNRSILKRYIASRSEYATYIPGAASDMTWMNPLFGGQPTGGGYFDLVRIDENGRVVARQTKQFGFPAGSGFWLILPPQTSTPLDETYPTLETYTGLGGYVFDDARGFRIPLYLGWNMIGNPYAHSVPWRGVKVTYQGETKTLQEASQAGWVQSSIFGYRTTGTPGYIALSDRDNLEPYEGYWVRAFVGSTDPRESLELTILP